MPSRKVEFTGASQAKLVGVLELPEHMPARCHAVFAHCFSCTKNSLAATRVSRALAAQGIATLRFDFTGLGDSEGELASAGFASNVADLVAAASWLSATHGTTQLLVGHSLGGTAAILAARQLDGIKALCTIGAPASARHLLTRLGHAHALASGRLRVSLAGHDFEVEPSFIDELRQQGDNGISRDLRCALLVMHAPGDTQVGIEQAHAIYRSAPHPRSFVSLDDADHLLTKVSDATYAAEIIATWARRYLGPAPLAVDAFPPDLRDGEVWVGEHDHDFWRSMRAGSHRVDADEPPSAGGGARGPTPYDLLLMSLGACTSMTVRLYAKRKDYPLEDVQVRLRHERLHAQDCAECDSREGRVERITRDLLLRGPLGAEQRADLLRVADRCPVHRTLAEAPVIATRLLQD